MRRSHEEDKNEFEHAQRRRVPIYIGVLPALEVTKEAYDA